MNNSRVDYDQLAETFDHRYPPDQISESGLALQKIVAEANARRIFEVGCGTGHWLELLYSPERILLGVDYSRGMLAQAQEKGVPANLVQGAARQLPVKSGEFDFVYCVNALHHFASPKTFIDEAYRALAPGGILAILGSNFLAGKENWYIYQYFDGVYEADLNRFPPWEEVTNWLKQTGSQLAMLSDAAYQNGLSKIKSDLELAENDGREIVFKTEIAIMMLSGRKPV
jgi:ubiquinone/menaquinone biosynthesis C-methylase UbiE